MSSPMAEVQLASLSCPESLFQIPESRFWGTVSSPMDDDDGDDGDDNDDDDGEDDGDDEEMLV